MPKMTPPEDAPRLWHWMAMLRVTLEELSKLVEVTPQHLSDVRRGVRKPSDKLKQSIATATVDLERQRGIARPKGVKIMDWYLP
jgi:transcriptional regulator with XRE-family HTH domain